MEVPIGEHVGKQFACSQYKTGSVTQQDLVPKMGNNQAMDKATIYDSTSAGLLQYFFRIMPRFAGHLG
jgi:hypothetical protein